ncbi:hypothetical protein RIF29_20776 [Crotalaria pallida]|uniref:Uncharacterized protein n=1 Tax=Crotalaria pallida TaxID=3830 RepID=A0AAN9I8Z4_CROPI
MKMQAFVVDTMQHLYRLWKSRLHQYYKSMTSDEERLRNLPPDLPQDQWEYCVRRFGSDEFKKISERNSNNRRSDNRCIHTTGPKSFAEFEDELNDDGVLEWADQERSKKIHDELKNVVDTRGDEMTQEEVLLEVLKPRSGYVRGKGTALRGYAKGQHQLQQQQEFQKQDEIIKEQAQKIKELEVAREQDKQELLGAMDALKQQMFEMFAAQRG